MFSLFKRKYSDMWLLVGLGNPGDKYKDNRHNIGFMVADMLAADNMLPPFRSKFQGLVTEGQLGGQKVMILKPQTYMNESGRAVKEAAKFFKINPDHIVVFHDELDLEPGKVRIKKGGGNAGNNGLKSIQAHMGTPDFWRVRMGIGHPGDKNRVSGYVLSDFSKSEKQWVEPLVDTCSRFTDLIIKGENEEFMSRVAMNCPPPGKQKQDKDDTKTQKGQGHGV